MGTILMSQNWSEYGCSCQLMGQQVQQAGGSTACSEPLPSASRRTQHRSISGNTRSTRKQVVAVVHSPIVESVIG
eukprot:598425-Pleurochrysis_carterae.AAC.4